MCEFISYYSEQGRLLAKEYGIESVPYGLMPKFAVHGACNEALNDLCALIRKGIYPEEYIFIKNDYYLNAKKRYDSYIKDEETLRRTAELNNKGTACERAGNIDEAIKVYEECIALGYEASHCYERLRIIYRKRKDYDNMARVIRRYAEVCRMGDDWAENEIRRYSVKQKEDKTERTIIYPTKREKVFISYKALEQRFYDITNNLPEFEFYTIRKQDEWNIFPSAAATEIRKLRDERNAMLSEASSLEKEGRLDFACEIYEELLANRVHTTKPYERLYMIYKRAKLYSDAISVLQQGVYFFKALRKWQYDNIHHLARKYNVTQIKGVPLDEYGVIRYYGGAFELYNPYPIIEKWETLITKL